MAKGRSYFYLIDSLTAEKGQMIKRAMEQVPDVEAVIVGVNHGVIEVRAARDPMVQLKMACEIAGTTFRIQVKRKHL